MPAAAYAYLTRPEQSRPPEARQCRRREYRSAEAGRRCRRQLPYGGPTGGGVRGRVGAVSEREAAESDWIRGGRGDGAGAGAFGGRAEAVTSSSAVQPMSGKPQWRSRHRQRRSSC